MKKGYSVIEILVVIAVFAVLAVVATQSISLSLNSSKKSSSNVNVRQELDLAADTIERLLQTASTIIVDGVDCSASGTATQSVGFRDYYGYRGDIACLDTGYIKNSSGGDVPFYNLNTTTNYPRIASSSAEDEKPFYSTNMTSPSVVVTSCAFNCYTDVTESKIFIGFIVSAHAEGLDGEAEGTTITTARNILVRSPSKR